MKYKIGDRVKMARPPGAPTWRDTVYEITDYREILTGHGKKLVYQGTPDGGASFFWLEECDIELSKPKFQLSGMSNLGYPYVGIDWSEDEYSEWGDFDLSDWRYVPPTCDCGAAAVGNIPHFDWCVLAGKEELATKRKPRHEFD